MELPQPSRPFTTEGRKTTHDFLSLYSHSSVQQDPRPSSHGGFLKTHNFLQPLDEEDKISVREYNKNVEKPPAPPSAAQPNSGEHVLHGGIGTYSISHISSFNPRRPKPEGSAFIVAPRVSSIDGNVENSNGSSYAAGSSYTLWEDSSTRKGKTGKEDLSEQNTSKEQIVRAGQWPVDRLSESSSNHRNSFSYRSSSQPPAQNSRSFLELFNSEVLRAKEEDEDEGFTLGEETTPQREDSNVKLDGKGYNDQKASTPRSKHSATEQRRRCKINNRFQRLREIIPNSDEKRDKASFLLEVIEYIQFLQEKVSRYEGSHPSWSNEPANLTYWRSSPKLTESFTDERQGVNVPVLMFNPDDKTNVATSTIPRKTQNPTDPNANYTNKATPTPITHQTDTTRIYPTLRSNNNDVILPPPRLTASVTENSSLPQLKLWQGRECSSDFVSPRSQEMAMEGGTINISSMYSQGLLNTLTQALKSSGVDLSHATVSVQVDIGKRANTAQNAPRTPDNDFAINNDSRALIRREVETSGLRDSSQAAKRLKIAKS